MTLRTRHESEIYVNYEVPPELLYRFVPPQKKLRTFLGKTQVSFIAKMVTPLQIGPWPIPSLPPLVELRLQFYVDQSASSYEFAAVPLRTWTNSRWWAWVNRVIYQRPYFYHPTLTGVAQLDLNPDAQSIKYDFTYADQTHLLALHFSQLGLGYNKYFQRSPPHSILELIIENLSCQEINPQAKYKTTRNSRIVFTDALLDLQLDFEKLFGPPFKILNSLTPDSACLVEPAIVTSERI